jgi:hypothetical protein
MDDIEIEIDIKCDNCNRVFKGDDAFTICVDCLLNSINYPYYDIFLDDARETIAPYTITCRNYRTFCGLIETRGLPRFISFDFDLGMSDFNSIGEYKTGGDCARYLVEYCNGIDSVLPIYKEHTSNPVGATEIRAILHSYEKYRKLK